MITLNNVPLEQKKKVEYLPKNPIYPFFVPNCSKCGIDEGVLVCTPADPKQYYCIFCDNDFFYLGCLNCQFADHPPFSFKCVRCTRNPIPEPTLNNIYYGSASHLSVSVLSSPLEDWWEPYKYVGIDRYYG